jgi:hypothetical protein
VRFWRGLIWLSLIIVYFMRPIFVLVMLTKMRFLDICRDRRICERLLSLFVRFPILSNHVVHHIFLEFLRQFLFYF